MIPQKTMTVRRLGIKFIVEGSPKFVDGWVARIKTPVESFYRHEDLKSFSSPHNDCVCGDQPKEDATQ